MYAYPYCEKVPMPFDKTRIYYLRGRAHLNLHKMAGKNEDAVFLRYNGVALSQNSLTTYMVFQDWRKSSCHSKFYFWY
jgi:hypothetical protein